MTDFDFNDFVIPAPTAGDEEMEREEGGSGPEQIPSFWGNNYEVTNGHDNGNNDGGVGEQHAPTAADAAVHPPPEPVGSHHAITPADADATTAMATGNLQAEEQQQQQQPEEEEEQNMLQQKPAAAPIAAPQININSGVDGIGMWKSWTHNYVEAKFACMDLLDNCFDATLRDDFTEQGFQGKVAMNYLAPNGIVILNNSGKAIKSLEETLTAYRSEKNSFTVMDDNNNPLRKDAIGEYGVGLKQACATLSDTSFVLTRNKNVFGFGVIAQALQTKNSVLLPHFAFTVLSETAWEIPLELKLHITDIVKNNPHVGQIVTKELGAGNRTFGIKRLVDQCLAMWTGEWKSRDYVFQLIISDFIHTRAESARTSAGTSNHPANRFLETIRKELPEHYINVPQTGFDFHIRDKKVDFTYWQDRLVEMTKFEVHIPKDIPVQRMDNDSGWEHTGYPLSIYCGFDALRLEDKNQANACQLYICSRQSGRLIESMTDARDTLGMSASGVDFSQGLTIIVDDHKGELPLKPTKDGLTWSKQASGEIHKSNLLAWVGAVGYVYWKHHASEFETRCKSTEYKRLLKEAVTKFLEPIKKRLREKEEIANKSSEDPAKESGDLTSVEGQEEGASDTTKRLENEKFTMFSDVFWTKKQSPNTMKVTIRKKKKIVSWKGRHTVFSFDKDLDYPGTTEEPAAKAASKPKRAAAKPIVRRASLAKKRKYPTIHLKPVKETPALAPVASASDSSSGSESEEEIIPKSSRAQLLAVKRAQRQNTTIADKNSNFSSHTEHSLHASVQNGELEKELQSSQEQVQTLEAELLQARRQLLYKPQQASELGVLTKENELQKELQSSQDQVQTLEAELMQARRQLLYKHAEPSGFGALQQENAELKKELLEAQRQLLSRPQPVPGSLERSLQAAIQENAWLKEQKVQLEKNQSTATSAQAAYEVSMMKLDIERLNIELKRQKTISEQLLQGGDQTVYPGVHETGTNDGFLDLGNNWL